MAEEPTIGSLHESGEVTDADLTAVASGWLEDRVEGPIPIGKHMVDVAKAVEAHEPARDALASDTADEVHKIEVIRTAIMLASAEPSQA